MQPPFTADTSAAVPPDRSGRFPARGEEDDDDSGSEETIEARDALGTGVAEPPKAEKRSLQTAATAPAERVHESGSVAAAAAAAEREREGHAVHRRRGRRRAHASPSERPPPLGGGPSTIRRP